MLDFVWLQSNRGPPDSRQRRACPAGSLSLATDNRAQAARLMNSLFPSSGQRGTFVEPLGAHHARDEVGNHRQHRQHRYPREEESHRHHGAMDSGDQRLPPAFDRAKEPTRVTVGLTERLTLIVE